jgi:sodium pump decarboxylase gamma subunit
MELDTAAALTQGLFLTIIGMGVVFTALTVIVVFISYFDMIERVIKITPHSMQEHHHSQQHHKNEELAPTQAVEEGISPRTIAAISAAIVVATGKKIRISRVRYRREPAQPTWATQGRATAMASRMVK